MISLTSWRFRAPSYFARLLVLGLLSAGLMLTDHRSQKLHDLRAALDTLVYPVQMLAALPVRISDTVWDLFRGKASLQDQYARLRDDHMLLLAKLQKYDALEAENLHLRELLGAAARVAERAVIAELLEVSPEPFTRKIVIAKGSTAGVYNGQPVIDAEGVVGRVTEVGLHTSKATLITDRSHALPVQVVRNGLRTIAAGTGAQDQIEIPFLSMSADIQEGDVLVTSGIGGTFPPGYPVARVLQVIHNPNESFLKIIARPAARLDHNKEVMLIWPDAEGAGRK